MKRLFLAIFAIFLIVLSAILYDVSSAKAASPYDTLVEDHQIYTLEMYSAQFEKSYDFSLDWYSQAYQSIDNVKNYPSWDRPGGRESALSHMDNILDDPNANWIVTKYSDESFRIFYTTDPNAKMIFRTVNGHQYLTIDVPSGVLYISPSFVYSPYPGNNIRSDNGIYAQVSNGTVDFNSYGERYTDVLTSWQGKYSQLFLSTLPVEYPPDYEGETIRDSHTPPEKVTLTPEYQYSVNSNGLLSVTYLKNITPFLSGTNYFVLNRTTDNWKTLGAQIFSESFTPAGWTDKTFEQLLDPGYYVLRISHSQTFDSSSPWQDKDVWVDDVYIQFFWDGETTFTGTTTGCEGQVCNIFQTDESEKMWNMFEKLGLGQDEFGLGAAVTAPLTFVSSLPSKAANCTPISLTLPYVNRQISLPCMTSIYQTHFGLIFSLFQTIMLGLFGYYAAVKVYGNIKQMKDPEDDRIEVVKL